MCHFVWLTLFSPVPFDKTCPQWKIEKSIQKLKATKKISFQQARSIVLGTSAKHDEITYAAVANIGVPSAPRVKIDLDGERSVSRASVRRPSTEAEKELGAETEITGEKNSEQEMAIDAENGSEEESDAASHCSREASGNDDEQDKEQANN